MNSPRGVLVWMVVFLAAVAVLVGVLHQPLREAFMANPVFNGMILGVLLVGIGINIRQVVTLGPDWRWLAASRTGKGAGKRAEPRLLASLVKILTSRQRERLRISAQAMRSLLDGIRMRLDESRDISHYMTGLLIFLGLLGTFWGLLQTVDSVSEVIAGLSAGGEDVGAVFNRVKGQLQGPLAGMGTAFSSSLFGLAGALVLGFLDLQAGHAQNRFFNTLEEWLSESAQLPSGAFSEGEGNLPTYVNALLEQTADSLDKLQRTVSRGEEERRSTDHRLADMADRLAGLTDQMRSEQKAMLSLTKTQAELQPAIDRLAEAMGSGGDEQVREHLRSVDNGLQRLLEETTAGREELVETLRSELRLIARSSGGGEPEA